MNATQQATQKNFVLNVGVAVHQLSPVDFDLVDIDKTGRVTPNGADQGIDVAGLKEVEFRFVLQDGLGLRFPADGRRCIGIREEGLGCPDDPSNGTRGMFEQADVSGDQRMLSMLDHNSGHKDKYRFALFLVDADGNEAATCDPRIVNN